MVYHFSKYLQILWPILWAVHWTAVKSFPVALTFGHSKPNDLELFRDTY